MTYQCLLQLRSKKLQVKQFGAIKKLHNCNTLTLKRLVAWKTAQSAHVQKISIKLQRKRRKHEQSEYSPHCHVTKFDSLSTHTPSSPFLPSLVTPLMPIVNPHLCLHSLSFHRYRAHSSELDHATSPVITETPASVKHQHPKWQCRKEKNYCFSIRYSVWSKPAPQGKWCKLAPCLKATKSTGTQQCFLLAQYGWTLYEAL